MWGIDRKTGMSKAKKSTISVQGTAITILSQKEEDYISLTDMARKFGDDALIYSWMRNRNTLEFIGIWERMHNPDFKGGEFETFKSEAGLNSFHLLTPSNSTELTSGLLSGSQMPRNSTVLRFLSQLRTRSSERSAFLVRAMSVRQMKLSSFCDNTVMAAP